MRTFNLLSGVSFAVLTSLAALSSADAANFVWDWTQAPDTSGCTTTLGNSLSLTNNGQTLTAESFSVTGSGTGNGGANTTAKTTNALSTARLFNYAGTGFGLAVTDTTESNTGSPAGSPEHTVSNQATTGGNQVSDMVAFKLPTIAGSAVNVTSIVLNQFGTDQNPSGHSNVSILIGGNSSTTLASLAGQSINQLEALGFHLLQFNGTGTRTITSTTTDSNDAAGANQLADYTGSIMIVAASLSDGTGTPDYIKIGSIAATSTRVPEPGTVAMFGFGLAGLAALRRRRNRS